MGASVTAASQSADCGVESRRCPNATGRPLSVSITELSKAMVCGALSMGHIKDPLTSFEKSRVVIPVAGFSYHLIDLIIKDGISYQTCSRRDMTIAVDTALNPNNQPTTQP